MTDSSSATTPKTLVHSLGGNIPLIVTLENSYTVPPVLVHSLWIHLPLIVISNILVISSTYFIKELHTPYHTIIAGLAIVDLMTGLVNLPETWLRENVDTGYIVRGTLSACTMFWFFSFYFSRLGLLYISLMSLERFLSIKFPIKYRKYSSIKKVVVTMIIICLTTALELILVLSFPSVNWIDGLTREDNVEQCSLANRVSAYYLQYAVLIIIGGIMLFAACLTLSVGYITHKMVKKSLVCPQNKAKSDELKRVLLQLKITVAIMCIYVILWIPLLVTAIIKSTFGTKTYLLMNITSRHCSFINAWINAIVYAWSKVTYRKAYLFFLTNGPQNWPNANKHLLQQEYNRKKSKFMFRNKKFDQVSIEVTTFKETVTPATTIDVPREPSTTDDGTEQQDNGSVEYKSIYSSSELKPKTKKEIGQMDGFFDGLRKSVTGSLFSNKQKSPAPHRETFPDKDLPSG